MLKKFKLIGIVILFSIITIFSYSQINNISYTLEDSYKIQFKDSIFLNDENAIYFQPDSMGRTEMHYYEANNIRKEIDVVDYTPYKDFVHVFSNKTNKCKLIIWESRTEYCPITYAYYYSYENIEKIGKLEVNSAKHYSLFPLEILHIHKFDSTIVLKFKGKIHYRACSGSERKGPYKFDSLKYTFSIATNKLEVDTYK